MNNPMHISVLAKESIEALNIRAGLNYVDATLGAAGHSKMILEKLDSNGKLFSFDQDIEVIERLQPEADKYKNWTLVHDNFVNLKDFCQENNLKINGGILLDLGFSSIQMDNHSRGFSFDSEAALDMRLDTQADLTAEKVINFYKEKDIADILYNYGEERKSRQIAKLIVEKRPFRSCKELADLIKSFAARGSNGKTFRVHPATKSFQALRIYVNSELKVLEETLDFLKDISQAGARIAIISFHSLEDRIVKHKFRELAKEGEFQVITKKPLTADEEELALNPRSRSAKLRVLERL